MTTHAIEGNPAWSPDGSHIVFARRPPGRPARDEDDIYTIKRNGEDLRRLTTEPGVDYDPKWSPDGRKILFTSWRHTEGDLFLVNPDGSGERRITPIQSGERDGAWSPDGREIVFVGSGHIRVMDSEGTTTRTLAGDPDGYSPAWSPNGRWVVFVSQFSLFRIRADGSEEKERIVHRRGWNFFAPDWQPIP